MKQNKTHHNKQRHHTTNKQSQTQPKKKHAFRGMAGPPRATPSGDQEKSPNLSNETPREEYEAKTELQQEKKTEQTREEKQDKHTETKNG